MAGVGDERALIDLCREMHAECAMFGRFVEDRVLDNIHLATERTRGICGVIDDPAGGIIGGILMVMTTPWYSDEEQWQDLFLYVKPAHRSAENFDKLAMWAKWFVDAMSPAGTEHPVPLCIGVMQPERVKGKIRLYEQHFKLIGAVYAYGDTLKGRMEGARHG
jgi:hypothetical protein